ncbi:MAG: hypothetical protein Q9219_001250 [cf. Caloplaca sp. 3 TL-2023]
MVKALTSQAGKSITPSNSDAPLRDIQQDPLSNKCIDLVQEWTQACLSKHAQCNNQDPMLKPSRMIEIYRENVCLRTLQEITVVNPRYCALSYCWGQSEPCKTTSANISHYRKTIPTYFLPKTIQDAILVTERLGIKYLWVDSLCIVQDSPDDLKEECSKMGEYYRSAYLVLSAVDSPDVRDGFLHPRPNINLTVSSADGSLRIRAQPPSHKQVFRNAALNKRGWALQERMLSSRILHYSKNELFWECLSCTAREGSSRTNGYRVNSEIIVDSDGEDLKASLHNTGKDPFALEDGSFSLWHRIVKLYTRRTFSYPSDKLAAVSGLAAVIADKEKAQFRFGLYEQDIHGLSWTKVTNHDNRWTSPSKRLQGFPTWSWLSWDGPVNYCISSEPRMESKNDARVIGIGSNLDSEARNDSLILSCLFREELRCLNADQTENLNAKSETEKWDSSYYGGPITSDFHTHVYDGQRKRLGTASIDDAPVRSRSVSDQDLNRHYTAICIGERYYRPQWDIGSMIHVATYFLLIHCEDKTKNQWKRDGLGVTHETRRVFSGTQNSKLFGDSARKEFILI